MDFQIRVIYFKFVQARNSFEKVKNIRPELPGTKQMKYIVSKQKLQTILFNYIASLRKQQPLNFLPYGKFTYLLFYFKLVISLCFLT